MYQLLPYESYDPSSQLFYNQDETGFVLSANSIVGAGLDDQQQMAQFLEAKAHKDESGYLVRDYKLVIWRRQVVEIRQRRRCSSLVFKQIEGMK